MYKNNVVLKKKAKKRIRKRIQKKLKGTLERPRIYVNKSNRYIYLQVIDDTKGAVLATASTLMKEFKDKNKKTKNMEAAKTVGDLLVKRLKQKKINKIIFDRGIYPYQGRIKTLAEALRKGGIIF